MRYALLRQGVAWWLLLGVCTAADGPLSPSLRFVRRGGSKPATPVRGQEHYEVDPATTTNADRTLSRLKQLAVGASAQPTPLANTTLKTPRAVFQEFCRLDSDGGQLTPEGWRRIASLFVQPGPPNHGKVKIVLNHVLSDAEIADDGKAAVMAEYIWLGELNPETAVFETFQPPGGDKARANFSLVQTKAGWKIEGAVPIAAVTVQAAMRYVTALRDKTTSERIRKNAARALAGLKRQLPASSR